MKIVIPMSGAGARFKAAGYTTIKPLIEVDGRPIIAHVVDLFPGEKDVLFICNREHLSDESIGLERTLLSICPTAEIVGIAPHKRGPVHTVLAAAKALADDAPAIVNYCDFSAEWDYAEFKTFLSERDPDGCITSYTGFHPHLLSPALYAGLRVGAGGRVLEVREKHSFTANKLDSHHSAGTYYFKYGRFLREYFARLVEKGPAVRGEFYVSSVYEHMLADGLDVRAYTLTRFMQWGTPEDLQDYLYWAGYFSTRHGAEEPSAQRVGGGAPTQQKERV